MTKQPFHQHPELLHPDNHRCGRCTLFQENGCPNPEDLFYQPFHPERKKNANSIACMMIVDHYIPNFDGHEMIRQSKGGIRSVLPVNVPSEISVSYKIEVAKERPLV